MSGRRPSQWPALFDIAMEVLGHTRTAVGYDFAWSFGGGTALMLQIDHRESHDIDLFVDDPQIVPFLNPSSQGYQLARAPDDYDTDGSRVTKLVFENMGEIDFICCADISDEPSRSRSVRGVEVRLETPSEIVAKKVYYRGQSLQPRDMFDMASVADSRGQDYVLGALAACGLDRCAAALAATERSDPDFVRAIVSQLMFRDANAHLVDQARDITADLLRRSVVG